MDFRHTRDAGASAHAYTRAHTHTIARTRTHTCTLQQQARVVRALRSTSLGGCRAPPPPPQIFALAFYGFSLSFAVVPVLGAMMESVEGLRPEAVAVCAGLRLCHVPVLLGRGRLSQFLSCARYKYKYKYKIYL